MTTFYKETWIISDQHEKSLYALVFRSSVVTKLKQS